MSEEKISFVRRPVKHGKMRLADDTTEQTYVFTIPQNYIRSGLVDPENKYKLTIERFSDDRPKILKIIAGLDEQLAFGKIDKETWMQLNEKYTKLLNES
jgi:hypothetical protein